MIVTDDSSVDTSLITGTLGLNPSRIHKKGDTRVGTHTGLIGIRPRTVWAMDSEWTIREDETVSHHIEFFKSILLPKFDILKQYKDDNKFELSFWIWIQTDSSGIEISLSEDELAFLEKLANNVRFALLGNDSEIAGIEAYRSEMHIG